MLMKKEIIEDNKKLKEELEKLKRLYETDRVSASEIIVEQGKEIEKLREENNLLKQIVNNDKKYSYGIRMGSDEK